MGLGATSTANSVHLPLRQPSPKYAEARFPLDLSTHASSQNTTILSQNLTEHTNSPSQPPSSWSQTLSSTTRRWRTTSASSPLPVRPAPSFLPPHPNRSPTHPLPSPLLKLTPTLSSNSRPRQTPPHAPILLPLLRLVPAAHERAPQLHRPLRRHQEAVRPESEVVAGGQECGALQGGGGGGGYEGRCGVEVLCRGQAVGVCGVSDAGYGFLCECWRGSFGLNVGEGGWWVGLKADEGVDGGDGSRGEG